jgi:hypothetical protein
MRGVLHVRNRVLLGQKTCCCYGIISNAYHQANSLACE